jgi:hypothetical protein
MLKLVFSIALVFSIHYARASSNWSLQVTDPSFELKNYDLDDKAFKPFMKKTSWRCYVSETQKRAQFEVKSLRCNYSVKKLAEFETHVSCGKSKPFGEFVATLNDEKKNLSFKLQLICRHLKQ